MDYIDNYKIVEKIGEGGMGEIYKGFEEDLQRYVAIKMLRLELGNSEDVVQRFKSERVTLAKMNHANIATVYKTGPINDTFYIAMEFVKGETLASILERENILPWQTAVHYAVGILEGLAHAHDLNIVHRDIKPSNLMITDQNTVKILDFGIAKTLDTPDIPGLTRIGHAIGTSEYMSPEQKRAEAIDARSDIYAVGQVLHEMLTGQIPFVEQKIPKALKQLVRKAKEETPDNRFSSASEFSEQLRNQLGATTMFPVALKSPPLTNLGWLKPVKRFCFDYPGVVFLFFVLIISAGYATKGRSASPPYSPPTQSKISELKEEPNKTLLKANLFQSPLALITPTMIEKQGEELQIDLTPINKPKEIPIQPKQTKPPKVAETGGGKKNNRIKNVNIHKTIPVKRSPHPDRKPIHRKNPPKRPAGLDNFTQQIAHRY